MNRAALIVCTTCRYSVKEEQHEGRSGGLILLDHLQSEAARTAGGEAIRIQTQACLMACDEHCNVALRAPGKICYVVGRMPPNAESARTLLQYLALYARSKTGQVPYRRWPQGIKGHFVARIPPLLEEP